MNILVYMDQTDKDDYIAMTKLCETEPMKAQAAKDTFWHNSIEKYPVLKNHRLSINIRDGFIFQWDSIRDIAKANSH